MDRQEFERTVKAMQNEGVPLTMANLLVRTELPRATIESWLDDMQRDIKVAPAPPRPTKTAEGDAEDGDGLFGRAKALKRELLAEAVKSQLGVTERSDVVRPKRDMKVGGTLGLVLPPAGLLYSAPVTVGALGSIVYLALAWLSWKFFALGGLYLLSILHLTGGFLGAAYAWRFNRKGKRTPLLPRKSESD
jgi:hypothetical protein